MPQVNMTTDIDVAAEEIWRLIGGFNALPDWHPQVKKSELQEAGTMRELSLVGGGTIIEKLERLDENARIYSYTIVDSPLPVKNYKSTIKVTEQGEGKATVTWSSEFNTDDSASDQDAIDVIQGIYQAGFDNLKKIFAG